MKKIKLILFYFLSLVYMEFIYRILLYDKIFRLTNINMILFLIPVALFLAFITRLFSKKANKIIFFIILILFSLWFAAQYVCKSFCDIYISFSILQIADQVGDFMGKAAFETIKRLPGIVLLFMPLILGIFYKKKFDFDRHNVKENILIIILFIISYGSYLLSLNIRKNDDYSAYDLYYNVNNPALGIEKTGVVNTFCLDIYRVIFGFDEKIIIKKNKTHEEVSPSEINYEYNNLDFDFEKMLNETNDKIVKDMTSYFINETGTKQNEYTGKYKGKNLILFMAESYNEIALKENIMPTLYKMSKESFIFENFYTPTIYSTIGGEFQELSGLYANFSSLSQWRSGANYFPMGIAKMFKNDGYNTYAYHNNSYLFQDRNVYLKNLGFDNFLACYNGLEKRITCSGLWPQSDVEMINTTVDDYINSDKPFMVFYASVSGHAGYTWANSMSKKHREEFEKLGYNYSVHPSAYLAAQMELDDAISLLIKKLEEAGKLDDTVIALVGDHYPYELTTDEVNEISTYKKDSVIEINHSNFFVWNNQTETTHITKVGSQIDVLPTLYNLFNLPYDSRLLIGNDILSKEPGLAMFADNSWVSDKGKYFSSTGTFVPTSDNIDENYVKDMNQDVRGRITMSKYIMDKDYYRLAWKYLKG